MLEPRPRRAAGPRGGRGLRSRRDDIGVRHRLHAREDAGVLKGLDAAIDDLDERPYPRPPVRVLREEWRRGKELFEELDDGHGLDVRHAIDDQTRDVTRRAPGAVNLARLLPVRQADDDVLVVHPLDRERDPHAVRARRAPPVVQGHAWHLTRSYTRRGATRTSHLHRPGERRPFRAGRPPRPASPSRAFCAPPATPERGHVRCSVSAAWP